MNARCRPLILLAGTAALLDFQEASVSEDTPGAGQIQVQRACSAIMAAMRDFDAFMHAILTGVVRLAMGLPSRVLCRHQQASGFRGSHSGLEAAGWRWHFAKGGRLFLFVSIYVWGGEARRGKIVTLHSR
jgi:hypothetical protein